MRIHSLLVFGIPKYSSRILLQWDPSAWTSSGMGDSPYNILNAQLPDPSWEWVHPEWLIDMSGDTDEAGWQYSGSFGHKFWPRVRWPGKPLPARGAEGAREINARTAKEQGEGEQARKKENEANNPDDEIEALQRNARAMRQKWRGRPDAWTFVRRRRWVRLRRRKALVPNVAAVDTEKDKAAEAGTLRASALGAEKDPQMKASELESSSSDSDDSAAVSDLEEDEVDSDNEAGSDYAPANARSSAWLPRRLPGDQSNGPNPAQARQGTELVERRRRHAREFTGTVRELKSLLPAILAPEWDRRARGAAAAAAAARSKAHLFTEEIDARNPFISWKLVKRRLEDDDLAFASATLRARERRHKQRTASHAHSASRRRVPSAWVEGGLGTPPNRDGSSFNAGCPPKFGGAGTSSGPGTRAEVGYDLTRDALVEINFRRVVRVLRSCRLDRQKLGLWRMWLAAPSSSSTTMPVAAEPARLEDLRDLGLAGQAGDDPVVAAAKRMKAERAMARWRIKTGAPDALDVWDVLERRVSSLLDISKIIDHALSHRDFLFSLACPTLVGSCPAPFRIPRQSSLPAPSPTDHSRNNSPRAPFPRNGKSPRRSAY